MNTADSFSFRVREEARAIPSTLEDWDSLRKAIVLVYSDKYKRDHKFFLPMSPNVPPRALYAMYRGILKAPNQIMIAPKKMEVADIIFDLLSAPPAVKAAVLPVTKKILGGESDSHHPAPPQPRGSNPHAGMAG